MSTRSLIAKQIGENKYLSIYCHCDGELAHNGAILLNYYNTPEKVDELLKLGNLSVLKPKLNPDPHYPHTYDDRQADVTVAYGRDRGERNVAARVVSMQTLDDPDNWASYIYVFTLEYKWKYFKYGRLKEGLRDVAEDLKTACAKRGAKRPQMYRGDITEALVEQESGNFSNTWWQHFVDSPKDGYCLFQMREDPALHGYRFMPYEWLRKHNKKPHMDDYSAVYSGTMAGGNTPQRTTNRLDEIYMVFAMCRPDDFTGHSPSVSDVIALKEAGKISFYFIDRVGFVEIPDFLNRGGL